MNSKSDYSYILGIQCFATVDSGASIIRVNHKSKSYDYVAISEERLIRRKYPYTFPLHSIKYCMEHFKIKSFNSIDLLVADIIREPVWQRSGPSYNVKEFDYIKSKLNFDKKKIIQIGHHLAHAASVYYTSGFKDSAVLIIDSNGTDLESTSFFEGKNNTIRLIDKYKARGIGDLYNCITVDCLNLGTGGEGKTMGLAPYGNYGSKIIDFSKVHFDGVATDYSSIMKRMPHSDILSTEHKKILPRLIAKIKKRKNSSNIMKGNWKRIAYDLQCETERCLIHLGKEIQKKTKSSNICLAGGVALNSVANQKLFNSTKFKNIFVYPACSDAGVPFGLAAWALYNHSKLIKKKPKRILLKNAYTGTNYSSERINSVLKKYKISSKKLKLSEIANHLSKGKIVAWFQGASEYGPRALGNRSILADSRNKNMADIVNIKVKHRETYRPFAPAVLEEDYKKHFKLKNPSPYMLLVAKVKNPKKIPAVTHFDGTARVQTISKNQNKIFYNLINEFKMITGIGCILNTSFNDAGEPIVETPEDAIITFLGTKIDFLVLEDKVIDAKTVNRSIRNKMKEDRSTTIEINEKKALNLLTRNYNFADRKKYFLRERKKAYWNAVEKPMHDLNKKVSEWIRKKNKIIIYGTYDHTKVLIKKLSIFKKLNVIGFFPYKHINDDYYNYKKTSLPFNHLKKISKKINKKTEILIGSYEFAYDIERELIKNYPLINYFKPYQGYSRDIKDHSKLKKFINKIKF